MVKWTLENDQRLLLLITKHTQVDSKVIAAAWAKEHGTTDSPTKRAIEEHLLVLKKKINGGSAPNTPSKSPGKPFGQTPGSSAKRSHEMMASNDFDCEEDLDIKDLVRRTPLSRRSKAAGKKYKMDSSDEDESSVKEEQEELSFSQMLDAQARKQTSTGERDREAVNAVRAAPQTKKPRVQYVDIDAESDISEFRPDQ